MKKLILTFFTIIICVTSSQAEEYEVFTTDGKKYTGELVERTESSITLYNRYTLQKTCFLSSEIVEATSAQGSRFVVEGGRIVGLSYEDRLIRQKQAEKSRMGDPNYAIGKAFKSSGSIALGVGVPCFVLGTILYACGVSYSPSISLNKSSEDLFTETNRVIKESKTASDCATTGVIFMSMGGAMTIMGIPLYVHGKRIMDLSLQVSENGAGVAFSL